MIERVIAPNPGPMTLTGTNTYLVGDGEGRLAAIDPGPDEPRHIEAILQAAAPLGTLTTVLVTHRHVDHLPGALPLCRATGATLVGHADLPGVQRALRDGEIAFGALRALATPGHTRESVCLWHAAEGALFTGDLVAGTGTVVLDDEPGALADYLSSLERLLALEPRTIYPGHGPIVQDAPGKLREYLEHRHERLRQVVDALGSRGPSSVDDLVSAIYTDVSPGLAPMAARNVRANLEKLASEGAVIGTGGRWQLQPVSDGRFKPYAMAAESTVPLRPAEFCALERQLVAAMAMRKKRNVQMGPMQQLKVQLLEYIEAADPEPALFGAALAEAVVAVTEGPGTGPAQAVASDLHMDWDLANASPGFLTWLRRAATARPVSSE